MSRLRPEGRHPVQSPESESRPRPSSRRCSRSSNTPRARCRTGHRWLGVGRNGCANLGIQKSLRERPLEVCCETMEICPAFLGHTSPRLGPAFHPAGRSRSKRTHSTAIQGEPISSGLSLKPDVGHAEGRISVVPGIVCGIPFGKAANRTENRVYYILAAGNSASQLHPSSMPHWFSSLLLGAVPLISCIILRIILDLRLAPWVIVILDKIPVRGFFRDDPTILRGDWEQVWDSISAGFSSPADRHSNAHIYQFGRYCYAEFTAKGTRYTLLGRIHNEHLFGEWSAKKDKLGYFGAFKLRIEDSKSMNGVWIGHSKKELRINSDAWCWRKTE